ncbi:MAG: cytochrome P460 family protein [Candidatus Sericytochromatia bacterium]
MKLFATLSVSSLVFTLIACTSTPQTPATPGAPAVSEPSAAELKTLSESYKAFPALNDDLVRSAEHGGIFVRTHLDAAAMTAFQAKTFPLPEGSVSVKEGHPSADAAADRVYVMKKIKGYDSANGDWFYAVLSPDGSVRQQGKMQMCIGCHGRAKASDYVFGFDNP